MISFSNLMMVPSSAPQLLFHIISLQQAEGDKGYH